MKIIEKKESGFSIIEALVTVIILMTGLLGLAGLQGRAFSAQVESYQRSQALILLKDMADRINANRTLTSDYKTSTPLGVGAANCNASGTTAAIDLCEWSNALKGSAENSSSGAMIGAQGCIYELNATAPKQYLIAIAWQGLTPTATSSVACGQGSYGSNEAFRRVISIPITIANLN